MAGKGAVATAPRYGHYIHVMAFVRMRLTHALACHQRVKGAALTRLRIEVRSRTIEDAHVACCADCVDE